MKRRISICVLFGVLAAFCFGLYDLFRLRYESGDVYPEYSSLRADPLGTMALYEALGRLPGVSVQRDYSAENQLPRGRSITYLHLAASRYEWTSMEPQLLREIEGFVSAGGRLVISFLPEPDRWARPPPVTPLPGKKRPAKSTPEEQRRLRRNSPATAWGFEFARIPLNRSEPGIHTPMKVTRMTDLPLPDELSWHTPNVFTNLASSWQTVYAKEGEPVLIERKLGLGTIVMATDSYFLSNEALLKDRQPALLAWMAGPSRKVLFDEAHLGIVEQGGITILMHKYGLGPFGLALLLLAVLFVWQNATSFPPPAPVTPATGPVAGKDAAAGFINLLRRNVPPADLLRLCFDEWTKSLAHTCSCPIDRVDAAQAVVESEDKRARNTRDPVRAYREIAVALNTGTAMSGPAARGATPKQNVR